MVAMDQGKKKFVDSKLSPGHGSKFSTQGSNRMLVVKVAIVKLQFFHNGFVLS